MGQARAGDIDRLALRLWLRDQFAKNVAWDKIVSALVTASGQNTRRRRALEVDRAKPSTRSTRASTPINGAVNYVLKFRDTPQDWAGSASKTFLGVQIQCAQCHDHKTEKWKQQDFQKFAACFMRAQTLPLDGPMMKGLQARARARHRSAAAAVHARRGSRAHRARGADGARRHGDDDGQRARGARDVDDDEPVVRARGGQPHVGRTSSGAASSIRSTTSARRIRPTRPSSRTRSPKDFADHGYDLKRLIRTIALSRGVRPVDGPERGARREDPPVLWSRFRATPLGPNELLDARRRRDAASTTRCEGSGASTSRRCTEQLGTLYGFVFDVDEEFDRPSFEGTITQALISLNGRLIAGGSTARPGNRGRDASRAAT